MKRSLQFFYYFLSFILSLYLLFSIVVEYTTLLPNLKSLNHTITNYILLFFVIDLMIQYFKYDSFTSFAKAEWISISALAVSISILQIFNSIAGSSVLLANKMYVLLKIAKKLKWLSKFAKGIKVVKSIKLGKKTISKYRGY